ncbi:MAG: carboxypeptidase regulatory-like domain-containing protein [Xanthobacteraceae bacterium]|nr:carboxypeptidase regulatory-like domain-containing protein [Xanthobacteraceae bacterium]
MRSPALLGLLGFVLAISTADAATISGTVTGPDGAPVRAAFVQARHAGMKMTVSVLTDNQGKYVVENLPAGDYRLSIRAPGLRAEPKSGLKLAAEQNVSHDFALQKGMVRWTDISILQGIQLLPNARGKDVLVNDCMSCHGFQGKMAATVRDHDGWRNRVEYMREAMRASLADRRGFSDQQAEDVAFYMNEMFGQDSTLPRSPTEMPGYKDTLTAIPDEALRIV